ncbi:MAG: tRNA lysidine(34) synthetase TilS [Moraxellaceae bacterium]
MSIPADLLQPFLSAAAASGTGVRRLVLGFSGGLDSTVLLHLLHAPAARHGLPLLAVHVHHGLQAAADDWVRHVEALCTQWQVPLAVCRVQVPRQASVEAAARQARQAAFAGVMQPGDVLLLAQQGSDQAETVLFRLLRGSGVAGLGAMASVTCLPGTEFPLWRPLLGVSRSALLTYAQAHDLDWVDDASNADTRFARNFLRHDILPRLTPHWPHVEQTLIATAARMQEAEALLAEMADELLARAQAGAGRLRCDVLTELTPAKQRLLLRHWLRVETASVPEAAFVQRMLDELVHARADAAPALCWQGRVLRRYRQTLYLLPALPALPVDWSCAWSGATPLLLPDGRLLAASAVPATTYRVCYRRGGEVLRRPGRAPTALKNALQAAGIPPWARATLPLLFCDGELRAVGGVPGLDEDAGVRFLLGAAPAAEKPC